MDEIPQKKLSRLAKRVGMNSLIHKTVPAYELTAEEKHQKEEERLRELRAEARERIARAEMKRIQKKELEEAAAKKSWSLWKKKKNTATDRKGSSNGR